MRVAFEVAYVQPAVGQTHRAPGAGPQSLLPFLLTGLRIEAPGDTALVEDVQVVPHDNSRTDALRVGLVGEPEAMRFRHVPFASAADAHRGTRKAAHGDDDVFTDEGRSIDELAEAAAGPDFFPRPRVYDIKLLGQAEEHQHLVPFLVEHR